MTRNLYFLVKTNFQSFFMDNRRNWQTYVIGKNQTPTVHVDSLSYQ